MWQNSCTKPSFAISDENLDQKQACIVFMLRWLAMDPKRHQTRNSSERDATEPMADMPEIFTLLTSNRWIILDNAKLSTKFG
ncbi:hypothetical protein Y032_0011g1359 [Ancylostoma ceylanicum]|uniref:Uncharacterized protein n=1 Tax=Ancylostoma ceylanicum TaxID=53326 RepID=A0A016VFC6_9BILA|nr:hypothetical protein Y032_0011g1359 [Ancylostoma ceylanicum]